MRRTFCLVREERVSFFSLEGGREGGREGRREEGKDVPGSASCGGPSAWSGRRGSRSSPWRGGGRKGGRKGGREGGRVRTYLVVHHAADLLLGQGGEGLVLLSVGDD